MAAPLRPASRLLAGAAIALALVAAAPPAVAPGPVPTDSVTVFLSPANPAGLRALAQTHGITPARRTQALARLIPGVARQHAAASVLRQLGLHVTAVGPWSVRASGPAPLINRLFGAGAPARSRFSPGLPGLPSPLLGLASLAVSSSDHLPVARPLTAPPPGGYGGPDLRTAYDGATPPAGLGPETVATVQLSGWDPANLATYANAIGMPNPLTDGQYTAVSVDGASPTTADGNGGDVEVALDQEALLGVAPHALQRAYVAPNNSTGFIDAITQVGADAAAHHIVALSISWGLCENSSSAYANFFQAMQNALTYTLAAGVTIFAASGDSGAADCYPTTGSTAPAVDYPASSPEVVAVGGTTYQTGNSPAESVWNSGNGQATGGGVSQLFAMPSWQQPVASAAGIGGTQRVVPDIASDANPSPGYEVYNAQQGGWFPVGGTSLSSPTQAGLLANQLAVAGISTGQGDLHPALYRAPTGSFRDITSGNNGGYYPNGTYVAGYSAGPGFDAVSGLGAPLWQQVVGAISEVSITSMAPATTAGGSASYGVQVAPLGGSSVPTGTVGISVDGSQVGTATLSGGSATVTVPAPAAGQHTITATYSGDASHGPASSAGYPQWSLPPLTGPGYTPVTPTRVFDSRYGTTANPGVGAVPAGGSVSVRVAGVSGSPVPSGASAVTVNVTVTGATSGGWLAVYPGSVYPGTSNLNFAAGQTVPNLVSVALASNGTVTVHNGSAGSVQVVIDATGYFTS